MGRSSTYRREVGNKDKDVPHRGNSAIKISRAGESEEQREGRRSWGLSQRGGTRGRVGRGHGGPVRGLSPQNWEQG